MKFCVAIPCFFGNIPFCEALHKVHALGFNAAETYEWQNLNLAEVRNTCEELGIELMSMCTSDFRLTVPQARNDYIEGLKQSCEAAVKMNVKRLITQGGPNTGEASDIQHSNIVCTLNECKPVLEHYGITLMLEPLNTYINHPDSYLWSSSEAIDIIKEVDSPNIKIIYDIYHQQIMEGNIISNIVKNLPYIEHLHAAGSDGRHELWLGESNYEYIFNAIDTAGYTGACGLEYTPTQTAEESLLTVRQKYLK